MTQTRTLREPVPEQIRQARESAGLTQAEAGALIGAPLRSWQDWEYGRRNMPIAKWELWQIRASGP